MGDTFPVVISDSTGTIGRLRGEIEFLGPSPGGGGGVQVVSVLLEPPAILDLKDTPVVLVPGVPDEATVVTAVAFEYLAGATPYTVSFGSFLYVGDAGKAVVWTSVSEPGFLDQATNKAVLSAYTFQSNIEDLATFAGVDTVLYGDVANPSDGDGDLRVTVAYFLAPVR